MVDVKGIALPVDYSQEDVISAVLREFKGLVKKEEIKSAEITKLSVDARKRYKVYFNAAVKVTFNNEAFEDEVLENIGKISRGGNVSKFTPYLYEIKKKTAKGKHPIIVGAGPAGLFCGLVLARAGLNPLIIERGKNAHDRKKDIDSFNSEEGRTAESLNENSNIQFGEGGAGTFSDGKLSTGIKNPRCDFVLNEMVKAGAPKDILYKAKPHVGTDYLIEVVANLRNEITSLGGEILFSHKLSDIITQNGVLKAVSVLDIAGERTFEVECDDLVLAIGHSARDTFELIHQRGLNMEQKPFAVGVRIEHKRIDIDKARYGAFAGNERLGAADYKLSVNTVNDSKNKNARGNLASRGAHVARGVYTFCMCPGGVIVNASSEKGHLAVNGMSEYSRDAENSNSALLVGVSPEDFASDHPLAGVELQRKMERKAFLASSDYRAPVQLVADFIKNKKSLSLGGINPSCQSGYVLSNLRDVLPNFVSRSIAASLSGFGRQLEGFSAPDAVLTGVESRSSSPVRVLRDRESGLSNITGIYPCGEGAGYAGGIMSAAVDGIFCAEKIIEKN